MVDRIRQHFGNLCEIFRPFPVGNPENHLFRLVNDDRHVIRAFIPQGGNGRPAFHQLSQDGFVFHNLGMELGVGSRRHHIGQQRDIGNTAHIIQPVHFLQFIDQRDHIDRFILGMKRQDRAVDDLMCLPVKIFRHQFLCNQAHCVLVDEHGSDYGLFRFYILRRHSVLHNKHLL